LQKKVCYAGAAGTSYEHGHEMLQKLCDLSVSTKQVERLTGRIGQERVAERDAEVATFLSLPLADKFVVPAGASTPSAVAVMCDGGRIQILDRRAENPPAPAEDSPDLPSAEGEFDEDAPRSSGRSNHWREDKIAVLLELDSEASKEDP